MMKHIPSITTAVMVYCASVTFAADPPDDHSTVAPACKDLEYLSTLFAFHGRPHNLDADRPVTVLISHGYMVGFSEARKQPVWAAYRVSSAERDTHYDRPPFFHDDLRLPESARIGTATFGGGFDRGHMVPNFAINTQYGKLAQMETFFMSNICPQKANLNQGLWARLEHDIVDEYAPAWGHLWVLTGPIFGDAPTPVKKLKDKGVTVPIPSHFFLILVDTHGRQDRSIDILGLKFPQNTPRSAELTMDFIESIDELERLTKLNFFPRFSTRRQNTHEKEKASEVWRVDDEE